MGVMIQVRNVPASIHRQLKARAALRGVSLSDYVLDELRRSVETPTREVLLERLAGRSPVTLRPSAAEVVRMERELR